LSIFNIRIILREKLFNHKIWRKVLNL
jgi:hypothetical protein